MSSVILVLGHKLLNDGSLSEELIGRMNIAINLFKRGIGEKLILSGGQTNNIATFTEAKAMAEYAYLNGIDNDSIILEEESIDTIGNAYFTRNIIRSKWKTIHVVTSCYHVPRALYIFHMCYGDHRLNFKHCYNIGNIISDEKSKLEQAKKFFKGMNSGDDSEMNRRIYKYHECYRQTPFFGRKLTHAVVQR